MIRKGNEMEHRPILSTYCTHQGLGIMTVQDLLRLDILFYAFGDVDGGRLSFAHEEDLALLPVLRRVNPELRLVLSLGGGGKSGFSSSTQTPAMRRALARKIAQTVHERGFDGVDIDWEFPTVNGVREERAWHAELLCLLRKELDRIAGGRRYLLSIAAPSGEWCFKTIDLAAIAPVLDYVCLMTYDMAGGGHLTCHHTAARSAPIPAMAEASVQANLEIFAAHGIPAEKILPGAAFYSRLWRDVRRRAADIRAACSSKRTGRAITAPAMTSCCVATSAKTASSAIGTTRPKRRICSTGERSSAMTIRSRCGKNAAW